MTNFISIDCHAHYEPKILNANGILKRMKEHGIEKTCLMSAVTKEPIYKKSDFFNGHSKDFLTKFNTMVYC